MAEEAGPVFRGSAGLTEISLARLCDSVVLKVVAGILDIVSLVQTRNKSRICNSLACTLKRQTGLVEMPRP